MMEDKKANKISSYYAYFKGLPRYMKIEILVASFLTLTILAALPVYAWFTDRRQLKDMKEVNAPTGLFISAAQKEDIKYEWYNSSIYLNDVTIGNTTACSIELDSRSSNNALLAGLCTFSTGYWCVDKIEIDKLNVTGKNASPFGMLVNTGERLKDGTQALYLELKDKTHYTISSAQGDLTFDQIGIYDELMAYSWWYKYHNGNKTARNSVVDNDAAVISINTNAAGDPVIMNGSSCNTYQNQSYYGKNTASAKTNPNSRYYYNLYTIRNKTTKTSADKLMLWSVYQYANSTFRSKFNPSNVVTSNFSISGDLDMTGYSYYPIDCSGSLTFGAISKLKFENKGFEDSEKQSADGVGRTTVGTDTGTGNAYHTQHYMMHCGLFRNYNSVNNTAYTLTTNNMVIEGSVGRVNNAGSGFIICGTLGGNTSKVTAFKDADTNTIKLNGAYVNGAYVPANGDTPASYPYSPLLINKVAANTTVNLYGVQTTADDLATGKSYAEMQSADSAWSAASSLIGQVGAEDGTSTNISLDFGKLTLDSRISDNNIPSATVTSGSNAGTYNNNAAYSGVYKTFRSIFNRSTLLHWFIYNTGCNGTYNYTVDEDWAASGSSHPHNVTYGQEITYTIDNGTLKSDGTVEKSESEQRYYSASRPYMTNPLYKNFNADGNEYYDFSKSLFRPYVGDYDKMDGTTHVSKYHELEVNLTVANLTTGCGCYNDPYDEQIPYFSEDKKKAIDKVYGILRDGRYCGADGYPAIISEDIFGASNIGNSAKKVKVPDTYTVLKKMSYCIVCGTNMVHFSDRSGFKRWRCTHKGCANFQPRIPDDLFVSAVQSIMNAVVRNPDMLETGTPLTVYEPTDEIRQAEKEISQLCAVQPIEYELIKSKALGLAVMKYNACTYSREPYITQELQDIIAEREPTNMIDTELLMQIASRITVDENKTIAIEFRNGKRIAYKEENNAEE